MVIMGLREGKENEGEGGNEGSGSYKGIRQRKEKDKINCCQFLCNQSQHCPTCFIHQKLKNMTVLTCPITRQFMKAVRLIQGIQHLSYTSRKPKYTPT